MKAKLAAAATAVLAVGVLAGCSPTVVVPEAQNATDASCAKVIVELPQTVSTLPQRTTDTQGTGAWGDDSPSILLRCGVPAPDPTSKYPCVTVNGIDWLRRADPHNVFVFTTYGRDPAVSVQIDSSNVKADGNQALTDLSLAVAEIHQNHKCVSPVEILQDGDPINTPSTPKPSPTPTSPAPSATPTTKP